MWHCFTFGLHLRGFWTRLFNKCFTSEKIWFTPAVFWVRKLSFLMPRRSCGTKTCKGPKKGLKTVEIKAREPGAHGRSSATEQFSETAIERSERHILKNAQAAAKRLAKRARKLVQTVTNRNGFRWLHSVVSWWFADVSKTFEKCSNRCSKDYFADAGKIADPPFSWCQENGHFWCWVVTWVVTWVVNRKTKCVYWVVTWGVKSVTKYVSKIPQTDKNKA